MTSTTLAQGATTGSPLARRDVVPQDVHAQLSFNAGGDGTCPEPLLSPSATPYLQIAPLVTETPQLGWPLDVCAYGFPRGQVDLRLLDLTRRVVYTDSSASEEGAGIVRFIVDGIDPRIPTGEYTVVATQGPQVATGTVVYERAKAPRVVRRGNGSREELRIRRGSTARYDLVGYPPGASVEIALYVDENGGAYTFATMLAPVAIDNDGIGSFEIATLPNDAGCYAILPDPRGATGRSFITGSVDSLLSVDMSYQDMTFCVQE